MSQAARISNRTAFFLLGEILEYNDTEKIFREPEKIETQNYINGKFG